ncbi:MAG: TadE family protein, partial [Natronosporangium sp.]
MSRPRRRLRGGRDRGSVAVEIAVVYPVILLLILGAVQFGVWWYANHVAHSVADAGLAAARADGATEQQAEDAAVGLLDQLTDGGVLTGTTVQVDRDDLQATVRVEGAA